MRRRARLHRRAPAGFTLVEMLVVFAIFAVIGVMTGQIVHRVIDNQRVVAERAMRLAQVQRAMQIIQRDIMQAKSRGVRDVLGDPLPPLVIDADGTLEFTRIGWRNPLAQRRSELQRVSYYVDDDKLYRAAWPTLDRAPDAEPRMQELLADVERVEFVALGQSGDEYPFWPVEGAGSAPQAANRIGGILMRMEAPPFGEIERVWQLPVN